MLAYLPVQQQNMKFINIKFARAKFVNPLNTLGFRSDFYVF